jgi:hypothetical protein
MVKEILDNRNNWEERYKKVYFNFLNRGQIQDLYAEKYCLEYRLIGYQITNGKGIMYLYPYSKEDKYWE